MKTLLILLALSTSALSVYADDCGTKKGYEKSLEFLSAHDKFDGELMVAKANHLISVQAYITKLEIDYQGVDKDIRDQLIQKVCNQRD